MCNQKRFFTTSVCAVLLSLLVFGVSFQVEAAQVSQVFIPEQGTVRAVVVVPGGVFLFNNEMEVHRIYKYAPLKKDQYEPFLMVDLNRDSRPTFMGQGRPSFGLDGAGNPIWDVPSGCTELAISSLVDQKSDQIVCIHDGGQITVMTHDGQLLWNFDLKGLQLYDVALGTVDADEDVLGMEFAVRRWKTFMRVTGDGDELGRDFEERLLEPKQESGLQTLLNVEAALSGKQAFDLDGNGREQETLHLEEGSLVIRKAGEEEPVGQYVVPGGKAHSVAVGDINGDGKNEIMLGMSGRVVFLKGDGTEIKNHVVNVKKARREPVVKVVGIHAMGLTEDAGPAVQEIFEKNHGRIEACYQKRHNSYALTRLGRALFRFQVDSKGKVKGWDKAYTTLHDRAVEDCVAKVVRGFKLPAATTDDAYVTADIEFTWKDFLE